MHPEVVEVWATTTEEKVAIAIVVMEAKQKEAIEAIPWFKASEAFMKEVHEVVWDAFIKGFKECKKMSHLIHISDLDDIIPDDPGDAGSEEAPSMEANAATDIVLGTDPSPLPNL